MGKLRVMNEWPVLTINPRNFGAQLSLEAFHLRNITFLSITVQIPLDLNPQIQVVSGVLLA